MDIIDIFVICVLFMFLAIFCVGFVYMMTYFQHPDDDTNECIWLYRITVISSFGFATFYTIGIPVDCASQVRDDSANLDLSGYYYWVSIICFIIFISWTILPAAIQIYTSEPDKPKKAKVARGVLIPILQMIAYVIIIVIQKYGLATSGINWDYNKINFNKAKLSTDQTVDWGTEVKQEQYFNINLGWFTSIMLFIGIFGSFFWCCLGGFGMAYLPIMLISSWQNKPSFRDAEDFTFTRLILRAENEEQIDEAKIVKNMQMEYNKASGFNQRRKLMFQLRRKKNMIKDKFLRFEEVMAVFKEEEDLQSSNPLIYVFYQIAGNIALLVSFAIMAHVIGQAVQKADGQSISTGLDGMLSNISKYLHFVISAVLFVLLMFYLQITVVKGTLVINEFFARFLPGVLPFKNNGTWMISFLVNGLFLQLCTFGLIIYMTQNLPQYTRFTQAQVMFDHMFKGVPFVGLVWNQRCVEFGQAILFILSCIYLLMQPSQKARVQRIMQLKKKERTEAMKKDPKTTN